jgi:tRNA pseudouridine55 synthase
MKKSRSGWLCLDKPEGISSNLAMVKVRRILGEKTGYIGTLDPFATGVLPIAVGEARKYIKFLNESEKLYTFTMVFGQTTDSLDKNGKLMEETNHIPDEKAIRDVIPTFIGKQKQIPPVFSAVKICGTRACDLARRGKAPTLQPKEVEIMELRMVGENLREKTVTLEALCSKGTYIRGLARDIAKKLKSLVYVSELRRTRSGFFSIKDAISMEKLQKIGDTEDWSDVFTSIESPLDDIPALYLGGESVAKLQQGLSVFLESPAAEASNVKVFDDVRREFGGICALSSDGVLKPVRMMAGNLNMEKNDVDTKQTGNH